MAYKRLDLTTGDLLDQDVFKHLEDGIEALDLVIDAKVVPITKTYYSNNKFDKNIKHYDDFDKMLSGDTTEVAKNYMVDRKDKIDYILALQEEKIPERILPYGLYELDRLMSVYQTMYQLTADEKYKTQAVALIERQMERFAGYLRYYQSISATHYRIRTKRQSSYV